MFSLLYAVVVGCSYYFLWLLWSAGLVDWPIALLIAALIGSLGESFVDWLGR